MDTISINGSRVIAITLDQKEHLADKNLSVSAPNQSPNMEGISEIGTLDTDAPASLNGLQGNQSPTFSSFIDETPKTEPVINNPSVTPSAENNLETTSTMSPKVEDPIINNPSVIPPAENTISAVPNLPPKVDDNPAANQTPIIPDVNTPTNNISPFAAETAPQPTLNNEPIINVTNNSGQNATPSSSTLDEIDRQIKIITNCQRSFDDSCAFLLSMYDEEKKKIQNDQFNKVA